MDSELSTRDHYLRGTLNFFFFKIINSMRIWGPVSQL